MQSRWSQLQEGLKREAEIAPSIVKFFWPEASFFKTKQTSKFDFGVLKDGELVAFFEIKTRKISKNLYDTTLVDMDKHDAGRYCKKYLGVPVLCFFVWTDAVGYIDLETKPDETKMIYLPGRSAREHALYKTDKLKFSDELFVLLSA